MAAAPSGVLIVQNLSPERVVAALTANHVPFTEVSVHRATLEEAYLELARDAADFRAVPPAQVPR